MTPGAVTEDRYLIDDGPFQVFAYVGATASNLIKLELCRLTISTDSTPYHQLWTAFVMTADLNTLANTVAYSMNLEDGSSLSTHSDYS